MENNKKKKSLIISIVAVSVAVVLAVTLGLVFGLKKDKPAETFSHTLASLNKEGIASDGVVSLDSETQTIAVEGLQPGDSFSFEVNLSNEKKEAVNYQLLLQTKENTLASSQLSVSVSKDEVEKVVYGSSNFELATAEILAGESEAFSVTISATGDMTDLGECVLQVVLNDNYTPVVDGGSVAEEVSSTTGLQDALTGSNTIHLSGQTADVADYNFTSDLVISSGNTIKICGESGNVPVINLTDGAKIVVEVGSTLELQNVIVNGHIETATAPIVGFVSGSEVITKIILNNVVVNGSEQTVTDGTYTDTKPAMTINHDTILEIVGKVEIYGNIDATAIGIAREAKIEITGDSLLAQGSGGYEAINTYKNYYNASLDNAETTDINEAAVDAATRSADPDFVNQIANTFTDADLRAKYVVDNAYKDIYVGGSAIGAIYAGIVENNECGEIVISNLKSLVAEGFGGYGFGVGGAFAEGTGVTITNTTIQKARGGINLWKISSADNWAKSGSIGGAAIGGVGNTAIVTLNNVIVKAAYGGAKAAAIGGACHAGAVVTITNSTLENIYGGFSAAAIGGGRYENNLDQPVKITISDSSITNTFGGDYAAGIGSGYSTDCRRADRDYNAGGNNGKMASLTEIYISGNSRIEAVGGAGGAGIGTGLNSTRVIGRISASVDTTGTAHGGTDRVIAENIVSNGEAIGLGSLGGQDHANSASLVLTGLCDVVAEGADKGGKLVNVTDAEKAFEIYNGLYGTSSTYVYTDGMTMQDFIDTVYNVPNNTEGTDGYIVYDAEATYYVQSGLVVETA